MAFVYGIENRFGISSCRIALYTGNWNILCQNMACENVYISNIWLYTLGKLSGCYWPNGICICILSLMQKKSMKFEKFAIVSLGKCTKAEQHQNYIELSGAFMLWK